MRESPGQWHERIQRAIAEGAELDTEWSRWSTWPFEGELRAKQLEAPVEEPERRGARGIECHACSAEQAGDLSRVAWRDDLWVLTASTESSMPFAAFLLPRRHADLQDLTQAEAARQGELLAAVERAAVETLEVPRIQVARWGDGAEHMHWWLLARPTGALQLRGTFLSHWDDLLPNRSEADLRADVDLVASRLVELVGGERPA